MDGIIPLFFSLDLSISLDGIIPLFFALDLSISLDGIIPLFFALDLPIILDGIKPTSIFFLSIYFVVLDFLKFSCVLLLCRYFLLVICSYFLAFHLAPDFGYNKFYITFSICFFTVLEWSQ